MLVRIFGQIFSPNPTVRKFTMYGVYPFVLAGMGYGVYLTCVAIGALCQLNAFLVFMVGFVLLLDVTFPRRSQPVGLLPGKLAKAVFFASTYGVSLWYYAHEGQRWQFGSLAFVVSVGLAFPVVRFIDKFRARRGLK